MKSRAVVRSALIAVLAVLAGCERNAANGNAAGEKLNASTPLASPGPNSPAGDKSADDPKTGLNTQRPDSQKDLKPDAAR